MVSKFASATVLECAGSSFLVVSNRNGAPSVVKLPKEQENKLFMKTDLELEGAMKKKFSKIIFFPVF